MKKSISYLIKYELLNNINNGFAFFFGSVFPFCLLLLLSNSVLVDLPDQMRGIVAAQLFLSISMVVPLATMFLGYAISYSNELEKNIPQRLHLFGISQKRFFIAKLIANYIFFTGCLAIYCIALFFVKIKPGEPQAIAIWLLVHYVFSAFLIALGHGIASIIKSFGPTYGVTLGLYFIISILSGMMGISVDNLPPFIQQISQLLPPTQIGGDYVNFWIGQSYQFAPLIQSMLTFGAMSLLVLLISFQVNKRENN